MRYHEIATGGWRVPISAEEQAILTKIGNKSVAAADLGDERAQEVARQMMVRGLLNKKLDKAGKPVYSKNSVDDIWINYRD